MKINTFKALKMPFLGFNGLLFALLSLSLFCSAAELTSTEIQEVARTVQLINQAIDANLLNPPMAKWKPEVQASVKYLEDLIEILAGPLLRSRGEHVVLQIFDMDNPNAWVMNISDADFLEEGWRKNHTEIWPFRKFYGIPNDKKPIHVIGITSGLLKLLRTRARMALVMSHEITHLLNGDTQPMPQKTHLRVRRWLGMQVSEGLADHGGIQLMLGKFDLHGATEAIEILSHYGEKVRPLNTPPSDNDTASAAAHAASEEHHDGAIRITLTEGEVQYLERHDPRATIVGDSDLPLELLHLEQRGAVFRLTEEQERDIQTALDFARPYLLKEDLSWRNLYDAIPGNIHGQPLSIFDSNRLDSGAMLAQVAYRLMNELKASSLPKKTKVNALLGLLAVYQFRNHNEFSNFWKEFNRICQLNNQYEAFFRFVGENSAGTNAWTADSFIKHLHELNGDRTWAFRFASDIMLDSNIAQNGFNRLIQVFPEWKKYFNACSHLAFYKDHQGNIAIDDVGRIIWYDKEEGPLRDLFLTNLLTEIEKASFSDLSADSVGYGQKTLGSLGFMLDVVKREYPHLYPLAEKAVSPKLDRLITDEMQRLVELLQTDKDISETLGPLFSIDEFLAYNFTDSTYEKLRYPITLLAIECAKKSFKMYLPQIKSWLDQFVLKFLTDSRPKIQEKYAVLNFYLFLRGDSANVVYQKNVPKLVETVAQSFLAENLEDLRNFFLPNLSYFDEQMNKAIVEIRQLPKAKNIEEQREQNKVLNRFSQAKDAKLARRSSGLSMLYWLASRNPHYSSLLDLSFTEFQTLLIDIEITLKKRDDARLKMPSYDRLLSPTIDALFAIYDRVMPSIPDFNQRLMLMRKILNLADSGYQIEESLRQRWALMIKSELNKIDVLKRQNWLRNGMIQRMLTQNELGILQAEISLQQIQHQGRGSIASEVQRVDRLLKLKDKFPDAWSTFREELSKKINLQPHEHKAAFPEDTRTLAERARPQAVLVRGLSAFAAMARTRLPEERLELINYLMGRKREMPNWTQQLGAMVDEKGVVSPAYVLLGAARANLQTRSLLDRTIVVNSLIVGPNGLMDFAEGRKFLVDTLLNNVEPQRRDFARAIAESLERSDPKAFSFALSYAFAQKPKTAGDQKLDEALIFKAFLDYYEAPGVKFAQYLAFTEAFAPLRGLFETYQDAAMPISYYESLLLVEEALGTKWDPELWRIVDVRGSGSINIAIEIENRQTLEREILQIPRSRIKTRTTNAFKRFRALILDLANRPENQGRFDFAVGLLDLVQQSTFLEFDRENAAKQQQAAETIFSYEIDGWKVRSVRLNEKIDEVLHMQLAPGIGARHMQNQDQVTYNQAMKALLNADTRVLRGLRPDDKLIPVPLFANPDIHNGQINIDKNNKIVTLYDYGQAVTISNNDRALAIDLLRIVSKVETPMAAQNILSAYTSDQESLPSKAELRSILNKTERMDIFIHLVSLLTRKSYPISLATVHWVLEANRALILSEKVGGDVYNQIRDLILSRQNGSNLADYNSQFPIGPVYRKLLEAQSLLRTGVYKAIDMAQQLREKPKNLKQQLDDSASTVTEPNITKQTQASRRQTEHKSSTCVGFLQQSLR